MPSTSVLLIGNRRDLASMASLIAEQFPDIACDFRRHVSESQDVFRAALVRLVVFYWKAEDDRDGFDALVNELERRDSRIPVLVITESDHPEVMLYVLRQGAVDCLCRPVNAGRLTFLVGAMTSREGCPPPSAEPVAGGVAPVAFESSCMRELLDSLRLAARSHATILLSGETGTGKNHLATFTHHNSPRRQQPLVVVDCGASTESLIESDLFGHVRGAFTGADRDHTGKLERAGNGTVLLDEVNSLPMTCQTRLLRALEERVFEKLGGEKTQSFGGRVIALTNKPLETEVAERRFRKDLYFRLNVISLLVPPLRERPEDIPVLVKAFMERLIRQHGSHMMISDEALSVLAGYHWPGNLRELRNVLERAVALSDSVVIEPRHLNLPQDTTVRLSASCPSARSGKRLADVRHEAERRELQRVLEGLENNRTRAAVHLGISRSALYKRLEKLGLT